MFLFTKMQALNRVVFLSAAMFALVTSSIAQVSHGVVTGQVLDATGRILTGARVQLQPGGASAVSDPAGQFKILDVAPGTYKMTAAFVGFSDNTVDVNVASGQTLRIDVTLQVASTADSVLVTAPRPHGEAEAINREINSENIVQVLPSEVITSLPNANIADALGRLPSVTLERDEGEGKYVQIRGTEPRYSNVTIDGVNVASAETARVTKLDIIPSDLVESVEINKTLLASMDGDAIGGSVNLRTKTAGDLPTLSLFGLGGYNPIINGRGNDQFGGTLGKRFGKEKKLGILFGGTYDWNGRGIDDIEPGSAAIQCDPHNCSDPSSNAPYYGTYPGADLREYRYYRERWGLGGGFDYKIDERSSVYVRGLYSHFNNFGDRWVYSPGINTFTTSPFQGDTDGSMGFNASIRRPVQQIGSIAAGGNHYFQSSWVNWEVSAGRSATQDQGYSQANFGPADNSPLNNVQFGVDLSNPNRPRFPVQNGVNIYDATQYQLQSIDFNRSRNAQLNLQAGASFAKNYNWGGHFGVFEAGFKVRNAHIFDEQNDVYYNSGNPAAMPLSMFLGGFTNSNYYDNSYQFGPTTDYAKIRSFFNANPGLFPVNVQSTLSKNTPNNWDEIERITAGYLQNSISFGRFRVYLGLRFEATHEGLRGNLVTLDTKGNYAGESPLIKDSGYIDPLPSVQVRYALDSESGIRIAYGRGIARPNYSDIAPYLTLNDKKNSVSAGNPNLVATHANNYDILYERYLKPIGLLQAGFFYKDISDPIVRVTNTLTSGPYNGFLQTQPINTKSAWLYGFEIAYQQRLSFLTGWLAGPGISANYSYTDSRANGLPGRSDQPALQRQAPHSWNISPTYDRGRVSLRVGLSYNAANIFSYQYQDGAPLGLKGPNGDNYLYAHLQVDAQASIRLAKGFSAVVYGLNLTNEVFGFYNGSPIWPNQREYYKPTIAGGVRWSLPHEK